MIPESSSKTQPLWHSLSVSDALETLKTNPETGLSDSEATQRLQTYGLNELIDRGVKSPWRILWDQVREIMVVVLIIAALISGFLGDWKDAIVILLIVVLNTILGFVQEYRAEQAMAALKRMAAPVVRVRRGGQLIRLESRLLVPGDVIVFEAGDAIPADARIIEAANLRVQEAALTGESVPVDKSTLPLKGENLPLGDRRNLLFMGTAVTYGRGAAVVTATGMQTELGRIADLIQSVEVEDTPLQKRMAQLSKGLAAAALLIVGLVFGLGLLRGEEPVKMFLTAVAMAVAAVPEGLPAVVTITLALGAQRMLKRQALVRKLPAVETLGSVTVICSDKTGTLTENRMTVRVLDLAGHTIDVSTLTEDGRLSVAPNTPAQSPQYFSQSLLLVGGALCNDAVLQVRPEVPGNFNILGDPTEGALLVAAARYGLWKDALNQNFPRVAEAPFSSERKRMTTVHQLASTAGNTRGENSLEKLFTAQKPYLAFTKGAVDGLLQISDAVWVNDRVEPMTDEWRTRIQQSNDQMAKDGLRVLGIAFHMLTDLSGDLTPDALEHELVFIGMVGMMDPPRAEVKDAVNTCKTAGIRPVMITGDHPLTALRIARDLGIATNDRVVTGTELAQMSLQELEAMVEDVSVFARVSPEHKLNIVQALQDKGHIVAMTGDGVNDAPALRRSDIGVAMGITGTDVSKEAANMVILDDNFATIVRAVKEGRTIYDNVRKFIQYTMTSNAGEIYVMLFAPFLEMPLPLTALQILWVNLVTDGLPGLALAVEPSESDTMRRKPYHPKENIFARRMGTRILWVGLLMGLVSLLMGKWAYDAGWQTWGTMVFTTLTLSQMGNAMAIRSNRESIFKIGFFSNPAMLAAVGLTFVLQLLVIYWQPLQTLFETTALSMNELLISLFMSTIIFWAIELEKLWLRRSGKM